MGNMRSFHNTALIFSQILPLQTLKYEESCRYLDIRYYYASETTDYEDEAMTIYVSHGCGPCSFWRDASPVDLNWAEGGTARVLDDDADSSILVFSEPLNHFQYCVFSNETLSTTLNILESMDQCSWMFDAKEIPR